MTTFTVMDGSVWMVGKDRYTIRSSFDGYVIYDQGEVICTFHGPCWDLASSTLRRLREGVHPGNPNANTCAQNASTGVIADSHADLKG